MTAATPACSPWQTMLCLWCHQTKFSIDLKQGHVEVTGPQPAQRHLSMFVWCSGPTGALSRVGQPEWEDGIRSYWLKLLIICEQVQRCCRAERGKDVCVCWCTALTWMLPFFCCHWTGLALFLKSKHVCVAARKWLIMLQRQKFNVILSSIVGK